MTTIDVDTSPLQAAREWRGIGLVVAARNAGLPAVQAEALESGDPSAFGSIDEMIASAVVYGASIGIGRDEAVALLDRTVCGVGADVALPSSMDVPDIENAGFSSAVRTRSARIADRGLVAFPAGPGSTEGDEGTQGELDDHPALNPVIQNPPLPADLGVDLPDVPGGPTPEQAVAASGEIHIDSAFGPEAPWERAAPGELERWAADDYADDEYESGGSSTRPRGGRAGGAGIGTAGRLGSASHAALERILGTDRADAAAEWAAHASQRATETVRDARERLRRSEHGTLILAIAVGAVLIALLVAVGGAIGGGDKGVSRVPDTRSDTGGPALTSPGAMDSTPAPAKRGAAPVRSHGKVPARRPIAIVAPSQLTVDVYNDGHQKGYAKTVAARLAAAHYRVGEVTNAKGDYSAATIIYPKTMIREARALGRQVGVSNLQEAPGASRRFTLIVK